MKTIIDNISLKQIKNEYRRMNSCEDEFILPDVQLSSSEDMFIDDFNNSFSNVPTRMFVYFQSLRNKSLNLLKKSGRGITFADLYIKSLDFLWHHDWVYCLDDFDDEIYKICCPFILYEISKCRWLKKGSDFHIYDDYSMDFRIKESYSDSFSSFMRIYGYNETNRETVDGVSKMHFEFVKIPTDINEYPLTSKDIILNATLHISPEDKQFVIDNFLEMAAQDGRVQTFNDMKISIKSYFLYPDKTDIYAAEIQNASS